MCRRREGICSRAPRSGYSGPGPSPCRKTPGITPSESDHDKVQSAYIVKSQPRHVVQLWVKEISLDPDVMEEVLPVLGGCARLDPGPGGCLDPEVGHTLGGCTRGVTGGHDAVDQRHILLGVTDLN